MNARKQSRILELETLRGGACISVYLNHFSAIFYPGTVFYDERCVTVFDKVWHGSILNAINNGNMMVQFFFVLSGYLLTRTVAAQKEIEVKRLWKRLFKLYSITTPAILIAYVLNRLGLIFNTQAYSYCEKLSYVSNYYTNYPSFMSCIKDIVKVLLTGSSQYVGPLWSMSVELMGSCMVTFLGYGLIWGLPKDVDSKKCIISRISAYLFFIILFSHGNQNYCSILIGAIVYELHYNGEKITRFLKGKYQLVFWIVGLYFATINGDCTGIYVLLNPLSNYIVIVRGIGVGVLLLNILLNEEIRKVLMKNKLLINVGAISSYVYAFHWPVLFSLGCGMFVLLHNQNYYMSTALIGVSCFIVTIILSAGYIWMKERVVKAILESMTKEVGKCDRT